MSERNRIKVNLVDHDDGFKFEIRRVGGEQGAPMVIDDFTAEAFKEYGDIFTEGLSLNNAATEQSITAAITNVSDLLNMTLANYDSDCTSFKCILASSISDSDGIDFITRGQKVSKDIFVENYAILAVKIFAAMRKTKAGNAGGSNIYRLVHCIVHQGGHTNLVQPYSYAIFTMCLQCCMFSYVCAHSLFNMPSHEESMTNLPLALLVFVYQLLLLLPEMRDTLAVGRSGFWDSGRYSFLRFFDVTSNIVMPVILLPIGVMLVLTADNLLEAVLSSTAVLFIPTLDNDIINLMGESDDHVVKKHIAQESIHQIADHFFRFQLAYEDHDHLEAARAEDLEAGNNSYQYGATNTIHNSTTNTYTTARNPYAGQSTPSKNSAFDDYTTATASNASSTNPQSRLLMSHRPGSGTGLTIATTRSIEAEIPEPILTDIVITGADALLKCVVFDAFCTTRSLEHLHVVKVRPGAADSTIPTAWAQTQKRAVQKQAKDSFSEIPRDSYHEVFFSESGLVSTSSLFTRMEYKIDTVAPYSIVYMKLWRLSSSSSSSSKEVEGRNTVEYRTKRYSDAYPTQCIEPGCFLITNLVITDCIDTLRICWSPTAKTLLRALNYYTIFNCDDAAEGALRRDTTTEHFPCSQAATPTRKISFLTLQVRG